MSCTKDKASELLQGVERIIEDNPDSALRFLLDIDTSNLSTNENRAKYSLLMTQALVKLDSTVRDDKPILGALNYYSDHTESFDYTKCLFYAAWLQYGNGQYYDAMTNATDAYCRAKDLNDYYWTAKSAELISFIYYASYNHHKSIDPTSTLAERQVADRQA